MRWPLLLVLALAFGPAQAHTLSVSHMDVTVPADGTELEVGLDVALRDIALTLPLDANGDEQVTWGELEAARPLLEDMVLSKLTIASASGDCVLSPQSLATRTYDNGVYAHLGMRARCPSRSRLEMRYNLLFDVDPQHRVLIAVHHGDAVTSAIGRAGASHVMLSAADNAASPFADFLREGVHHILIGYDHLAFLILLLLPAALIRRDGRWQPEAEFRNSTLRVLQLVTAFTAAHSITLTLAVMGWITPASHWIEIAIAGSVVLAALNNLWPLVTRRVWLIAGGFGLIHGFGFAGALGELGLPTEDRLLALIAFNLGVEVGQIAVVAVVMPILYVLRLRRWYAAVVLPAVSILIAALGGYWMIERLTSV
ncbi:MAG: HupE/UreJ family protein [Lysobacter sp.]